MTVFDNTKAPSRNLPPFRRRKLLRERGRPGLTLLEMLGVVAIVGIMAAVVIPRLRVSTDAARVNIDAHQRSDINTAVERWHLDKGSWPAANLSDIGSDPDYLPDGVPIPPQGGSYTLDSNHRVIVTP